MVKFLHTADWQMGMKAHHAGDRAAAIRAVRFETIERIAELALTEKIDFVLVAGDTFEDHDIGDDVVRRTVAVLNRFAPVPVYIIPGNHDPLVGGSIWDRTSWRQVDNHVRLLREEGELQCAEGTVLYPCPLRQKQSMSDPTAGIPNRTGGDDRIRVGLAHGALDVQPGYQFPIKSDRAEVSGLDYLGLGDWHGFFKFGERTIYPGSPEQTSYKDNDPGNVALVTIAKAGSVPVIEQRLVGRLRWYSADFPVTSPSDIDDIESKIRALGAVSNLVLKLNIMVQTPDPAVRERLAVASLGIENAFLPGWTQTELAIDESANLPGLFSEVDTALRAWTSGNIPAGAATCVTNPGPEIVHHARALLRILASGGKV